MSTEASPKGKGARAPTNANDANSIIPLLLATIGNPTISFKKMAAMDELERTESSLEHKFRKWREKGREIASQNPEHTGTQGSAGAGAAASKKPRALSKNAVSGKGKGPAKQVDVGDDDEDEVDEKAGAIKQEPNETGDISNKVLPQATKGKSTAQNSNKKRAASEKPDAGEREGAGAPAKKAKVVKKGTAKVVKKPNAKAYSGSEDEDVTSEAEDKVSGKPKGKGRGNIAAANGKGKAAAKGTRTGPAKAKKGKADVPAKTGEVPIHEDEDADVDSSRGDDYHDGMIEMQFDEDA